MVQQQCREESSRIEQQQVREPYFPFQHRTRFEMKSNKPTVKNKNLFTRHNLVILATSITLLLATDVKAFHHGANMDLRGKRIRSIHQYHQYSTRTLSLSSIHDNRLKLSNSWKRKDQSSRRIALSASNKDDPVEDSNTWSTSRKAMSAISLLGALETGYLTYSKLFGSSEVLCGTNGGCTSVLDSSYASVGPIPLALFGLVSYSAVLLLSSSKVKLVDNDGADFNAAALRYITGGMAAFSLFLMSILFLVIRGECVYCMASAAFSTSLALLAWTENKELEEEGRSVQNGLAAFGSALALSVVTLLPNDGMMPMAQAASPPAQQLQSLEAPQIAAHSTSEAVELATSLQKLDAKMYGAFWCSHCLDQKERLGMEAFAKVKYVECAKEAKNSQTKVCKDRDVPGYPTWEINGKLYPGEQDMEELEDIVKKATGAT